jgi:hypothetical protein
MPYEPSFGTIQNKDAPIEAPKPESPFRIAILADFSGRQNRGEIGLSDDIAARHLFRVGRDNLDEMMAKLGVQLQLAVGDDGNMVTLWFNSLDDFHPDQIHDRVDQIADGYGSDEKSALMNTMVHHPDFQALESVWRGLDWLLARASKGGKVEVVLVDVSLVELVADVGASEDLGDTGLYQLLIEKGVHGPKGEPWALLVGNYSFDLTGHQAELLGRLAKIAGQTMAPFLTTVQPEILDKSFTLSGEAAPAWQALRQLPEAALLGVAVPRFLLRLPYGENTQQIDKFSYEEISLPPDRSHYLWGNPALACAALLAQTFHKQGWSSQPGTILDLEDMPIHVYTLEDEEEVTLAEAWLARPESERLVKQGIMPFLCVRGKGALHLGLFLSLAQPPQGELARDLCGRWSPLAAESTPPAVSPPPAPKVGMVGQPPPRGAAPASKPVPTAKPAPAAQPAPAKAAPAPKPVPAANPPASKAPPAKPAAPPGGAPVPKVAPAPVQAEPPAPAPEEEMDPELAALLKDLEGGT